MGTKRSDTPPPEATPAPPVQASASQTLLDTRNRNLLTGLSSGKDVRDISELSPYLNLYDSSVKDNTDYSGDGLLSTNELSGGNSQQLGLISKQIAARNKQQAQGDLYNSVQNAQDAATSGLEWGAGMDQNRELGNAGMANQRYTAWVGRPKPPSIWQTILGGAFGVAGQLGAAAINND